MSVNVTREEAPVSSVVVTDTTGHRCIKVLPVEDGATIEHDADHFVNVAFLSPAELRILGDALFKIAADAEERNIARDAITLVGQAQKAAEGVSG